ncbi:MAG: hypothetical protein SWY16_10535 [Cyanobacteriota bacterium]|nr:hypothetical protein [Cyanobacteriota bacterium]
MPDIWRANAVRFSNLARTCDRDRTHDWQQIALEQIERSHSYSIVVIFLSGSGHFLFFTGAR